MSTDNFIVIALDGGAASGKSTTAKLLAEKLNFLHVDTGTHYRAITLMLLRQNIKADSTESIVSALSGLKLDTIIKEQEALLSINGTISDLSELRAPAINDQVSYFAAIPEIRKFLLEYQRSQKQIAKDNGFNGIAIEGRDVTSVIFPDADYRFFLEADEATRNRRRALQGEQDSVAKRDSIDSSRKAAPMVCPPGAIRIDTSALTREQAAETILNMIKGKVRVTY